LKREIHWLFNARRIVKAVLDEEPSFMLASERSTAWWIYVTQLPKRLRRSVALRPPTLDGPLEHFLCAIQKPNLEGWLKLALEAIHSRHEIIRMDTRKAEETNLKRLRGRVRASSGSITMEVIQAALGQAPMRQQIWGISGQVPIGVELNFQASEDGYSA